MPSEETHDSSATSTSHTAHDSPLHSPSALPNPNIQGTYITNTLGLSSDGVSWPRPTTIPDSFLHDATDDAHAHAHLRLETYVTIGGWGHDEFGRDRYYETGKIEEVDAPPFSSSEQPSDSVAILPAEDVAAFQDILTEPLPECTTPPPRPSVRVFEVAPEEEELFYPRVEANPVHPSNDLPSFFQEPFFRSPGIAPRSASLPKVTTFPERVVVEENLSAIVLAAKDMNSMCSVRRTIFQTFESLI